MILLDIGNTHAHILENGQLEIVRCEEILLRYRDSELYYICVNSAIAPKAASIPRWRDISPLLKMPGFYTGMGADRRALCLSRGDGIYIDAGSAITVDIVRGGEYAGGTIIPGIKALERAYTEISPLLSCRCTEMEIDFSNLPTETCAQLNFGILATLKALVSKIAEDEQSIYICGGDGALLADIIDGALYDEKLLFEGMAKVIGQNRGEGL